MVGKEDNPNAYPFEETAKVDKLPPVDFDTIGLEIVKGIIEMLERYKLSPIPNSVKESLVYFVYKTLSNFGKSLSIEYSDYIVEQAKKWVGPEWEEMRKLKDPSTISGNTAGPYLKVCDMADQIRRHVDGNKHLSIDNADVIEKL